MKKITLLFALASASLVVAQSQVANSDLELWENLGAPTEEPINWNSFKTGSGNFAGFANKQIEQSTNIRAGATGMYCARIWSTSVLGIVANGTMTCGRINMGSTTPSNPANYNYSSTADPLFSETCVNTPDSIVFWVKYTQAGGGNQTARLHAILHDAYDVHDPIDAGSDPHVIATAELDYPATGGSWTRKSVPFIPTANTGLVPGFILVTFATNSSPGGGAANDEVLIDDISLVYNGAGVDEQFSAKHTVNYNEGSLKIFGNPTGDVKIYAMNGSEVYSGIAASSIKISLNTGLYVVQLKELNGKIYNLKFAVN